MRYLSLSRDNENTKNHHKQVASLRFLVGVKMSRRNIVLFFLIIIEGKNVFDELLPIVNGAISLF